MAPNNQPSRFARFLGRGGIEASPTDQRDSRPSQRPVGRVARQLALVGLMAGALVIAPGAKDQASAQAIATGPNNGATIEETAKTRYQEHLERGIEMTWFRSGTRPMTTVLYFDRNRLSMGVERHGGIDRPEAAEGAPEFNSFMVAKQVQYASGIQKAMSFSLEVLNQVPGYQDAEPGDGSGMGDMKAQVLDVLRPNPAKPITVVEASAKVGNVVNSALALAEYHDIELPANAAEEQQANLRELQTNAVVMSMAVNARAQTEGGDASQRVRFLQHLMQPATPPEPPPMTVSADASAGTAGPAAQAQRKRAEYRL